MTISIHALLAESDVSHQHVSSDFRDFYPRSPCGERQSLGLLGWLRVLISIHALLAESDPLPCGIDTRPINFYPRSPCGERLDGLAEYGAEWAFLSTLSLRRATYWRTNH